VKHSWFSHWRGKKLGCQLDGLKCADSIKRNKGCYDLLYEYSHGQTRAKNKNRCRNFVLTVLISSRTTVESVDVHEQQPKDDVAWSRTRESPVGASAAAQLPRDAR
jgi:hypothetical protein